MNKRRRKSSRENGYRTIGDFYGLDKFPKPLSYEEEQTHIRNGNTDALVMHNMRFAVMLAKQYRGCGCDLEDLIQEAALGLVEAARKAEAGRGTRFLSYAATYMRRNVKRALGRAWLVPMPYYLHGAMARWHATNHQLLFELNREPTFEEAFQEADINVSAACFKQFLRLCRAGYEQTNGDFVLDSDWQERIDCRLDNQELAARALGSIEAMDAVLLWLRYCEGRIFSDCGQELGYCREAVRCRTKKAKEDAAVKIAIGGKACQQKTHFASDCKA